MARGVQVPMSLLFVCPLSAVGHISFAASEELPLSRIPVSKDKQSIYAALSYTYPRSNVHAASAAETQLCVQGGGLRYRSRTDAAVRSLDQTGLACWQALATSSFVGLAGPGRPGYLFLPLHPLPHSLNNLAAKGSFCTPLAAQPRNGGALLGPPCSTAASSGAALLGLPHFHTPPFCLVQRMCVTGHPLPMKRNPQRGHSGRLAKSVYKGGGVWEKQIAARFPRGQGCGAQCDS